MTAPDVYDVGILNFYLRFTIWKHIFNYWIYTKVMSELWVKKNGQRH